MPLNIRPRRSALMRTRLPKDAVLAALRVLLDEPSAPISGGHLDAQEFRFDYRADNGQSSPRYGVHGKIQDTTDWRLIRLNVRARSPWMGWWVAVFALACLAIPLWVGDIRPRDAAAPLVLVLAIYAFVNLLWIPGSVTSRVASLLASALRGSVHERGQWVVPPDPD